MTLALPKSENRTRIPLTVSEIFDPKQVRTRYFFILILIIIIIIILSFRQKDGHATPPRGMDRSGKFGHHFKDSDRGKRFFDFGEKIPTR